MEIEPKNTGTIFLFDRTIRIPFRMHPAPLSCRKKIIPVFFPVRSAAGAFQGSLPQKALSEVTQDPFQLFGAALSSVCLISRGIGGLISGRIGCTVLGAVGSLILIAVICGIGIRISHVRCMFITIGGYVLAV